MSKLRGSKKAARFTESVIREMTRLNQLHGGVNLSQGFPDFPAPAEVKEAACAAIRAEVNQYAITWGARSLREAIARDFTRRHGKVHDFLTVGAPAPLQEAGASALALPDAYYQALARQYQRRRDLLLGILERHGFTCFKPYGAYYIMTDIGAFGFEDDVAFARHLVKDVGVAAVPGSSFYRDPALGRTKLRFCFCKKDETMLEADRRLGKLSCAR